MEQEQEVPAGKYVITEEPLDSSDYIYRFVVTNIVGKRHYSYTARMYMTKTVEELEAHPQPDGESAAVVDDIFEYAPIL